MKNPLYQGTVECVEHQYAEEMFHIENHINVITTDTAAPRL